MPRLASSLGPGDPDSAEGKVGGGEREESFFRVPTVPLALTKRHDPRRCRIASDRDPNFPIREGSSFYKYTSTKERESEVVHSCTGAGHNQHVGQRHKGSKLARKAGA